MRNRRQLWVAGGVVTATGCVATLYLGLRKKRRDRRAATLLQEVTRQLKPATAGLLSERAFDLHYLDEVMGRTGQTVLTLKKEVADAHAQRLQSAWRPWWRGGDDEQLVYGTFRQLRDKVQVAQLAAAYMDRFGVNLIDALNDRMDDQEINQVLAIIRPLPAFRTL